jgi:hypothetical protein
MSINPLNDISRVYLEQVASDCVTEVSADLALRASKEAGKRAGILAGLSGGDPKVAAKAKKKRAQAERLYSKQAKRRVVTVSPIKEEENVVDETSHLETDMKKRREANEKAVEDMKKTDAYKSMAAAAAKKFDEALDPVGHEDDDVDNDGKKNTNADKYLKNRRKAIGKAISTHEAKEVKRWWDDDGDGKGYEEGEVSGKFKKKKKIKEGFSNWRQDLSEVMDVVDKEQNDQKITEKKVNNKIKINPSMGEAVENLGGTLLEMVEIDEMDYVVESVYDELLEEGYEEDDIEEAIEYALTEATVTYGHDTPTGEKKRKNLVGAVARLARQKLSSKVRGAKKAAKQAVATGARKVAKGALGVARKMEGGDKKPHTAARKPSTYRGAGAGQKEKVSSGSYTPPSKKKAEKSPDPWAGSETTPPKAKAKTKKAAAPKAKATTAPKRKRKSKLDDLLASVRSESVQIDEKVLSTAETKEKERIVKSMKSKAPDFEKRYPGRGKEVMYATATKMAKRMAEQAMEIQPKTQAQPQQSQQANQDAKAKAAAQRAKSAAVTLKTKELQTLRQTPAGTSVSSFG